MDCVRIFWKNKQTWVTGKIHDGQLIDILIWAKCRKIIKGTEGAATMTDIKKHEPLWGAWRVDSLIGEGSFGKVYKVLMEEFGDVFYSAVKMLSIPYNEADLLQARYEGMDEESIRSYFYASVGDIAGEGCFVHLHRLFLCVCGGHRSRDKTNARVQGQLQHREL